MDEYQSRDIDVILTGVKGPVRDAFKRSGLDKVIGPEQFFLEIDHAVESLDNEGEETSYVVEERDDQYNYQSPKLI